MWKVSEIENVGDTIWVRATDGFIQMEGPCDANQFIYPPNFIERLLGVTFERKVKLAIKRCQEWCNKENEKNRKGEEFVKRFQKELI